MRLVLTIGMSALLGTAMMPAYAQDDELSTVSAIVALCKTDAKKCQDQIGMLVMTGVQAKKLPSCTSQLDLPELSGKILDWWKAHPNEAADPDVIGVANALNSLKPC